MQKKKALISVFDKQGIVEFSRELIKYDFEILSTGKTAKILREAKIPVTEVSEYTGFPEILDGRVKTLHPKIHAGILARRNNPEDMQTLKEKGIDPIDLVVVNLYPFEQTIAQESASPEEIRENIDIGGPSLIRAAAKNQEAVTVIVDYRDYPMIQDELKKNGEISKETKAKLAAKAFKHTAYYDSVIANYFAFLETKEVFPEFLEMRYEKIQNLRYGENPHQKAAFYQELPNKKSGISGAKQFHGKELSFCNILDINAAWELVLEFDEPTAAIIKHTNPCGCASAKTIKEAYELAKEADPVSRFGGIIGLNCDLDKETAEAITAPNSFYEAIIAPKIDLATLEIFKNRKGWGQNVRLVEMQKAEDRRQKVGFDLRRVSGGILIQEYDTKEKEKLEIVTNRKPTEEEIQSLLFAWKVVKYVKSNAIVIAKDKQLLGVGAGQMNRVNSVKLALAQAQDKVKGSVLASDAFFPFPDGPEEAAKAGVTAIIQPGGSVKDSEVIALANRYSMAMVFTGIRHFRH
ncbi:MAG: bifunctional phosphoribosylaminoimidazolecarboxamide formyltransferase/IMP cyclohydrolase [Candidatus Edwardsbacteria bacterium]